MPTDMWHRPAIRIGKCKCFHIFFCLEQLARCSRMSEQLGHKTHRSSKSSIAMQEFMYFLPIFWPHLPAMAPRMCRTVGAGNRPSPCKFYICGELPTPLLTVRPVGVYFTPTDRQPSWGCTPPPLYSPCI
jgi:hypothetical protein